MYFKVLISNCDAKLCRVMLPNNVKGNELLFLFSKRCENLIQSLLQKTEMVKRFIHVWVA